MKFRANPMILVLLSALLVAPAVASTVVYDNGPINGTVDAWTINFGYLVTDSFTVPAPGYNIQDLHIGVWLIPGDSVSSVDAAFGSAAFGGTFQTLTPSGFTDFGLNIYGYDLQQIDFTFANITLAPGTYWVTLQNAVAPSGDPIYWDENDGPSLAFESAVGAIGSESFSVTGTPSVPEPGSLMLFGSGMVGLAGFVRRKITL